MKQVLQRKKKKKDIRTVMAFFNYKKTNPSYVNLNSHIKPGIK